MTSSTAFYPLPPGLMFGTGLSPFPIICQCHAEALLECNHICKAKLAKQGGQVPLADADTLISTDICFANSIQVAAHNVTMTVHAVMLYIVPHLSDIYDNCGNKSVAISVINWVLFAVKGDYFQHLHNMNVAPTTTHSPTFQQIIDALVCGQFDSLSSLPTQGYLLNSAPCHVGLQ
eukprot:7107849-Ditylum_brightwellii.AAC.2